MKKILKYIALFLNLIAILALLGAFVSPMINPEKMPVLAAWGLFMPYALIINILFIAYWVVKAKFYFVLSLLAILISWSTIKTSFPYHHKSSSEEQYSGKPIKVLSYNVRLFNRYNWTKEDNTVTDMLHFIKNQSADIICLQEFGTSSKKGITETFIMNSLKEYPYHYIPSVFKKHKQGLAILSKYPIVSSGTVGSLDQKYGGTIYTDIDVESFKMRVINAHFESIPIDSKYKYNIVEGMDSKNYWERIKGTVRSINVASEQHTTGASDIIKLVEETTTPVILCADMNSTPVSYSYHRINKYLEDAYLHYETGFGATYNGIYPFLRIDYIFHSKDINVKGYKRYRVKYSDHFPITTEFNVTQ